MQSRVQYSLKYTVYTHINPNIETDQLLLSSNSKEIVFSAGK